jgi:hypothetical protein
MLTHNNYFKHNNLAHLQTSLLFQIKQEGHDGPEVAYLWPERGQFKPRGFYLNKLGRHLLEDVSC